MHGTWRHEPFPEVLRGGSATWAFKEYGPGGCLGAGRRCYIGSHTHILAHLYRARSSHTSIYGRALLHADIHLLVWLFITFNFAWPLVSYFLPGHPPFETYFATRKTAMWVRGLTCVRNQWIWMVILPNRRADLSSPINFRFCIHCIEIRIVRIHPPRSGAFPWWRRWNKIVCDFLEYPLHKTHYFTAWTNLTCK